MFIGKVTGNLVATQKEPNIADAKFLVVEACTTAPTGAAQVKPTGRVLVAIDSLGAGIGEYVLVTQGSSARMTEQTKSMPVDAVVIGIVEAVQLGEHVMSRADGTLADA
jgi:ethanolamine utilization protein EutN